jgi:hypothetical protein
LVDRIMSRPDPANLAPGTSMRDAAAAAMLDARGRGNFSGAYRDRAVQDVVNKTLDQAGGQHSGLNFENILRQNLRQARSKEAFGNLRPEEEAAVEKLIRGTIKSNTTREFANMLGGGGGLGRMAAMGVGGTGTGAIGAYLYGGDPWLGAAGGLALGLTGRGLRTYGNAQARRGIEEFSDTMRRRTPEYASRVAAAPMEAGPGMTSPTMRGLRTGTIVGADGNIRDAITNALIYQTTGKRREQP